MNLKTKRIISIILIIGLMFAFSACDKKNIDDDGLINEDGEDIVIEYKPAYGGKINVPITYIKTLNPILNGNLSLYYFNKLIFEGLFDFNETMNVKPLLAEKYEIGENGRIIKVKLRENISWHDGNPFTAEDVKFTIDVLKYGSTKSVYFDMLSSIYKPANPDDLLHILNVKIIDDFNIEIIFDRSYSNALESLIFPIIPKHQFFNEGEKDRTAYENALIMENYNPIGTGPYRFVEYQENKIVRLEYNPNWWNGKVYIEEIVGQILTDEEVAITAFESQKVDLALALEVDWEKYAQNNQIDIYDFISQNYVFLGFNFANELFAGEKGQALRKAIAYGINRQNIINKVYLGHGSQIDVPISPNSWLISDKANTYTFNVNKAKNVLEEAGWEDKNDDGFYEDEKGNRLSIRLLTNSYNELRQKTADIIVENLRNIGIEVLKDYSTETNENISEEMAQNQWQEVLNKISNGDFDMTLLEWELSYIPDLAFAFHSSQIEAGTNIISYNNESIDNLIVDAFQAESRIEKKETYDRLQSLLVDDLPYVSLFFKDSALLLNSKIKGDINPQSFNIYYNIQNWFIPEELQEKE